MIGCKLSWITKWPCLFKVNCLQLTPPPPNPRQQIRGGRVQAEHIPMLSLRHWRMFILLQIYFRARSTSPWIWGPRRPELCVAASTNTKRVCAQRNSRGKIFFTQSANLLSKLEAFSIYKIKHVKDGPVVLSSRLTLLAMIPPISESL